MREFFFTTITSILFTTLLLLGLHTGMAQVMGSTNYRIQSDSVNMGGGLGTSTNYSLESTAGEVATGELTSTSYALKAGYQQMQEVYISLSGFSAVALSPSIPGISGGISDGSTTVTVVTDSVSGYQLQIAGSQSPAMQKGGDTIADYAPVGADPDFGFTTTAVDAHLGYSPSGVDIATRFKDNGVDTCNLGGNDTALSCWDGLSTIAETVARRTSANHPLGSTTTLNFRVGVGGSVGLPSGTYTATTTLTALPL
jgi:hypothetical protein